MSEHTDEEIRVSLKSIIDHFDQEDRAVRDRQIRMWRRLKLTWDGFQKIWYSEVAHDWQVQDDIQSDNDNNDDHYDKPINVFRAYLETIIAALSIQVPPVSCSPDDAQDPMDISTAKAGNIISELIYKHNNVTVLWIHALFVYCTEGLVACYNYTKEDESFGTYEKKHYKDVDEDHFLCPECEAQVDEIFENRSLEMEDQEIPINCPECATELDPNLQKTTIKVQRLDKITDEPKSRQILEVYGGLYVKIPNYAINQAQCPYLFFSHEIHYAEAMEQFKELRSLRHDWQAKVGYDAGGLYDPYERWGRLNTQYRGEYPVNTVTIRKCWLRPCSYNVLPEEQADAVREKFPKGVKVVLANEEIAEDPIEELLDDHWTLTKNPLSDYLHHDPLGLLLTSIQDITNELVSLTLQTIEHGIPQTIASPEVLNFDQYRQTEVSPGAIYPGRISSNQRMGDAFYEIKTATLSSEVLPFGKNIQEFGQLVVGAPPSLFGGAPTEGSKTAAEYSMSRAQALQRQQNVWKMLVIWWKTIFGKAIPAYINNIVEDERFVKKDTNGKHINVFIRKAELQGKIGDIECEADEQLPISWSQVKDTIMSIMESGNPVLIEALTDPENLDFVKKIIGLPQFRIPGEADRLKQYEEIDLLLKSSPIPRENPETDEEEEGPSIPIDPDIDNNAIQASICRGWAISEPGQLAKIENSEGYRNVILHLRDHTEVERLMMLEQQMQQAQGGAPPSNEEGAENVT